MKIGIPKEVASGETRVALVPGLVKTLVRDKHDVLVETGAGQAASFPDETYTQQGARIVDHPSLYREADVILKVQPSRNHPLTTQLHEGEMVREGTNYIGFLSPHIHADVIQSFAKRNITAFSLEYVPRITRAQSMDALSSMATVAGYKAVLLAADLLPKMFPLLMTAAGTVPAATVVVLGAGVAGLQAIATAKRLGAKVEAFDPRPAVRDQVKSLGATFIEMELPKDAETAGGYAKELSLEFIKKEMEAIGARLPKANVVISTAQVFGKKAPVLMTEEMVGLMPQGSVIVDLAAEQGGNCTLTQAGKTIEHNGVTILGAVNLPATVPIDASQMLSKNIVNLFQHIFPSKEGASTNFDDDIVKGCCITRDGAVVNEGVKSIVGGI